MSGEEVGGDQGVDEDSSHYHDILGTLGDGTEHTENKKMRNQSVDDDDTEMNEDVSVSVTPTGGKHKRASECVVDRIRGGKSLKDKVCGSKCQT